MNSVSTVDRLVRITRDFAFVSRGGRKFAGDSKAGPSVATFDCGEWEESSEGDELHKLVLVVDGMMDVEGGSGGWLVMPNHMIFVPANRPFNLRTAAGTRVNAAFLDPNDHPWHHHGCWVTQANPLVHEIFALLVDLAGRESGDPDMMRHLLKTISMLCTEWFSNPRMLWLPAAKSPETRAFVSHVREHLDDVTVESACRACALAPRTMQRLAQQEFSFGPKTLISEVRIMRAMELLAADSLSLDRIARAVGYSSSSAFTIAFSGRIGRSPLEYRLTNRTALQSCRIAAD
ncbi:helix-turn-helix domain-containing protein [Taklimakanibacter deserti]|uniref:helix-turn-helix domain-containing protein n=1 Tax=Taklimakanibacter deserti TaxID=2267839 RepID=UPI0013C51EAF